MFPLNPNGESGGDGSAGVGGPGDPRLLGARATTLGARVLSASGAEPFIM